MIKVKIKKDSDIVAKIVLIDKENKILFLKRSDFHKKHPGELDLPGGHLKEDESLSKGLAREVKEETGLDIKNPIYFKTAAYGHMGRDSKKEKYTLKKQQVGKSNQNLNCGCNQNPCIRKSIFK